MPGAQREREESIDLNLATEKELAAMPLLGPDLAHELVAARPIRSWESLRVIPGFSEQLIERLKRGGATI